jgi:uncharacterized iron-regulated membrane protein
MSWRRIHFWLSLVGLTQMTLWVLSGVGLALLPDKEVQGLVSSRRLKAAPVAAEKVILSPSQVAAVLQRHAESAVEIQKLTLTTRGPSANDRLVYVANIKGESAPRLIDACTGDELSTISPDDASNIARQDFVGEGAVTGVEWIIDKYQNGFEYNGSVPAYRVLFSDRKHTRIYVSPHTGQILARRNIYKTARDLFWTLHVFGYLDREVRNNVPLITAGTISLAAAMSGLLIYIPYIRRRRVQPAAPRSGAWRKIHFWIGFVVFTQIALWLVSGMMFSLIYDRALGGERETRNLAPATVATSEVEIMPAHIPAILMRKYGHSPAIRTISLQSYGLDDRPIYVVATEERDEPAIIDAQTGKGMHHLKPEQAQKIAEHDFTGAAPVQSVETLTRPYQKGYDYFGELPVYRVNFANWKGTRIYVSPETGDIRLRRNFDKSVFDFFWTLHMFGYVSHDINGNPGLILAGAVSMLSLLSGIALYFPYVRRKLANRD